MGGRMKNEFTVAESMELLDSAIQREMTEIFNASHKAQNFQKLADDKFLEMANIFEKMLPCKQRVKELYNSIEENKLINKLDEILIREANLKRNIKEQDEDYEK